MHYLPKETTIADITTGDSCNAALVRNAAR